jgi:ATP synthase protein I
LLGISPWGFIVFLLLGFVAGVLNVMRSAGVVPGPTVRDGPPSPDSPPRAGEGEEEDEQ